MYQFIVLKATDAGDDWQDLVMKFEGIVVVEQDDKGITVLATYDTMKELNTALGVSYFKSPPDPCLIGPFAPRT